MKTMQNIIPIEERYMCKFDGVNDYIEPNHDDSINVVTVFKLQPDGITVNELTQTGFYFDYWVKDFAKDGVALQYVSGDTQFHYFRKTTATTYSFTIQGFNGTSFSFPAGVWNLPVGYDATLKNLFSFVIDYPNRKLTSYINGVKIGDIALNAAYTGISTMHRPHFGRRRSNNTAFYNGYLISSKFVDAILTEAEIQTIYNSGVKANYEHNNLIYYYVFNGNGLVNLCKTANQHHYNTGVLFGAGGYPPTAPDSKQFGRTKYKNFIGNPLTKL